MAMIHKWTYSYTPGDGYMFGGVLEAGQIRRWMANLTLDGLTAGSACTVNPTTDGIIPARFTATNLTKNFPAKVTEGFGIGGFSGLQAEVGYSDGPQCVDGNHSSQVKVASTNELAPNQSVRIPVFIIVKSYLTPLHPDGDPAVLQGAKVRFGSIYVLTTTGPGIEGAGTVQAVVPLGG
jgi:hypothetical protein